ncbi:hypothetical protein ACF07S_10655 [Streptomyces sp. NPDC016640]|uniref:hypothetical protein n=1 Tax=Streptomyces sp. NPDC016640 TaxID=3364969 RepID=UPI0036F50D49
MPSRQDEAFDAAAAIVTCILSGDMREARSIAFSSDTMHADMILVLASALAAGHTAESWRESLLAAYLEDDS